MEATSIEFRIPYSWDIALRVIRHAARHGQNRLEIVRSDNGYFQLRKQTPLPVTTKLDLRIRAETSLSTVVTIIDATTMRMRPRHRRHVRAMMEAFQADLLLFARLLENERGAGQPRMPTASIANAAAGDAMKPALQSDQVSESSPMGG